MGNLKLNIEKNYTLWNNVEGGEEWSKHFETTYNLWDVIILPKIKPYIKGDVLEIAPGHGRITRKLLESNINLDILDLSNTCIERCRKRFGGAISNYYVGNGSDLKDINSNSKDFIISFDSFVHMHEEVINSYLSEINRVLKLGGYCWILHSNLNSFNEGHNLKVINQELIKWDAEGNPDWLHDGFSLIKK